MNNLLTNIKFVFALKKALNLYSRFFCAFIALNYIENIKLFGLNIILRKTKINKAIKIKYK